LIAQRHKPGIPTDWATTMGPLVSRAQFDKVMGFIESAHAEGARLVTVASGRKIRSLPKVFSSSDRFRRRHAGDAHRARGNFSAPCWPSSKWKTRRNVSSGQRLDYGLTASIWNPGLVTAHRAASRVQAGFVWIQQRQHAFPGVRRSVATSNPASGARNRSTSSSSSSRPKRQRETDG